MAVEKMKLVNIMGRLDQLDDFLEDIIEIDEIDQVSALLEIQNRDFSIKASEENIDRIEDFNDLESFPKTDNDLIGKLKDIEENFDLDQNTGQERIEKDEINLLYSKLQDLISRKKDLEEKKKKLETYVSNYKLLQREEIDIEKLQKLRYFSYRYGEVSKEGRFILKNNYENIPSTIIHLNNGGKKANPHKEFIEEIISIDNSTISLRDQTDAILKNEKDNVNKVSIRLEKDYDKETKKRAKDLYDSILSQADLEVKEIEDQFKKQIDVTKKIYDENKDDLVDHFVEKIIGS